MYKSFKFKGFNMRNIILSLCCFVAACGGEEQTAVQIGYLPNLEAQVMCANLVGLDVVRLPADAPPPEYGYRLVLDLGADRTLDLNGMPRGSYTADSFVVTHESGRTTSLAGAPDRDNLIIKLGDYLACSSELAARLNNFSRA